MKRILTFITVLALVLSSLSLFSVSAADQLTVLSCTQISDSQILVKFSEPIAANYHGNNYGPFIALRIVDSNDTLIYDGDTPLQYSGSVSFIDSTHDTIIFEYDTGDLDITTVRNFGGSLGKYSGKGYTVRFCMEEVPFSSGAGDMKLDNITTVDGSVYLTATKKGGWDGHYSTIEEDFSITVDRSKFEDFKNPDTGLNYGTVFKFKTISKDEAETDAENKTAEVTDNKTADKTADNTESNGGFNKKYILLGAVVVASIILVVGVLVATGGKKKPEENKTEEAKDENKEGENK